MWRASVLHAGNREAANHAISEACVQAIGRGDAIRDPTAWVEKAAFRIAQGTTLSERSSPEIESSVDAGVPDDLYDLARRRIRASCSLTAFCPTDAGKRWIGFLGVRRSQMPQ